MTDLTTSDAQTSWVWLPDAVGDLVVQPAIKASIAATVSTVVRPSGRSHAFYVPVVTDDVEAKWTAENTNIDQSKPSIDQAGEAYHKIAALTRISNEMVSDADPAVLNVTGASMARSIADQIDQAFFSNTPIANGPTATIAHGITPTYVNPAGWADLDPFAEAISNAESVGAEITSWVVSPEVGLKLAQLKDADDSNRPLLGSDPTQPTGRSVHGIPLYVSRYVEENDAWGIPGSRVFIAIRQDATVEADRSVYFAADAVALRAITRVAFAFPHGAAIQHITPNGGSGSS